MKKVKIFLASSEELKEEKLELSDLLEHLNLILEPQDIHIYLEKWEYLGENIEDTKKNKYEERLGESDICMVVFGKEFSNYTETELKKAYDRVCHEGVNPSKLYIYFKNEEKIADDLKKFRDSFPEVYGHFTCKFSDVNTLKNDFLLQFQLFQNKYLLNSCPIEVTEGKVTVNGRDLFIDFSSLPYVSNVKRLNGIKNEMETIDQLMPFLSIEEPLYAEKAEERRNLEEEKAKLESTLWDTAIKISEFKEHKLSNKLKRAIELFERGEIERILEIVDNEELKVEAQSNIDKIKEGKRQVSEGYILFADANLKIEAATEALKNNIREFQLAIQAEELNMSEGWGERVIALHEDIIKYTREIYGEKSEEYIDALLKGGSSYDMLGKNKDALKIEEQALSISLKFFGIEHPFTARSYNDVGINIMN